MLYPVVLNSTANAGGFYGTLFTFLPLILIFGIFYMLTIRPQRKKERELRNQINAMQVGDQVVTIGGIVGKVMNISGDEVTISTSVANTMMTFKKSAIGTIESSQSPAKATEVKSESKDKK